MQHAHRARFGALGLATSLLASAALLIGPTAIAVADSTAITFEPPAYTTGNIHGQNGWSKTGPYDAAVVSGTGIDGFGDQSLRISNAVTSGSFGDQTFAPLLAQEAGETHAFSATPTPAGRHAYFTASWEFASASPSAEQPGLSVVVSPDAGDGGRMSYIQMADAPDGLRVSFYEYVDVLPYGTPENPAAGRDQDDEFVFTTVASALDRTLVHSIELEMWLFDGPRNDVVNVWVDDVLVHTGTSWEDYFRWMQGPGQPEATAPVFESRTIRTLLFRTAGTAAPGTAGGGFLVDNVAYASEAGPVPDLMACAGLVDGNTYRLTADCTTDHTLLVPDGWTLDGEGHTITAVDPAGDHFRGAVVANAGSEAHVTDVRVTADGLANVCDDGDDRLRGILLNGAGGSITSTRVIGVNQGPSGCQEGNAIEARNDPFDASGTDVEVVITDNLAAGYIKNGITVNGSVAATVTGNVVIGSGPVGVPLAAQNGIQVGYGATAYVRDNVVSGNDYTPDSYQACGLLLYVADGVRASRNSYSDNESNVCNYGKGTGRFDPNV